MTSGPVGLVAGALVTASLGSIFAAGDAALSEIPEGRLQALCGEPGATGAAFRRFKADPTKVLSRWLVCQVVALSVAAGLFIRAALALGYGRLALPAALVGNVLAFGVLAEVLGTLASRRPERAGALALLLLQPLEWALAPLADPLAAVGRAVGRRVPRARRVDARTTETEVAWAVREGEKAGVIANEPAEMIRKVLDFKDLTAGEVMVPRRHILGIEMGVPLAEVLALIASEKHSRYPVYRETIDNVVGLLYAKDLFAVVRDGRQASTPLSSLTRSPVLFFSEHESIARILQEMRSRRLHMAIVSDEFGGTAGLITIEDILEEIVGDIRDEYDVEPPIQTVGDGRLVADGSVSLSEVAQALGKPLPDEGEFESLGGLIVGRSGHVPEVGATLQVGGVKLIVREADEKRVVKVEIVPERTSPPPSPS